MASENETPFTFGNNRHNPKTPDTPPVEGGDTGVAERSPHAGGKHVPAEVRELPLDGAETITPDLEVPEALHPSPAEEGAAVTARQTIAERREQAKKGMSRGKKIGLGIAAAVASIGAIGGTTAAVNHFGGERYEVTIDGETEEMKAKEIKELQPGAEYHEIIGLTHDLIEKQGDMSREELDEKLSELEGKRHEELNKIVTPKLELALDQIKDDSEADLTWLTFSSDIRDQLGNVVEDLGGRTLLGEDDKITVVDSDFVDNRNLYEGGTADRKMTVVVTHGNGSEHSFDYSLGDVVPMDIRMADDPTDIRLATSAVSSAITYTYMITQKDPFTEKLTLDDILPNLDPSGFLTELQKRDTENQLRAIIEQ